MLTLEPTLAPNHCAKKNNQDKALFGGSERGRSVKQYFILIVFQILVQMRGLEPPRPKGH